MNYSRKELIATEATMNQMRNSIHILASFMEKNGVSTSTLIPSALYALVHSMDFFSFFLEQF